MEQLLRLLLLAVVASDIPRLINAVYMCGPNEVPTFIRISRTYLTGIPLVVSKAGDDISCAQFCKNNIEPTTGAQRACASFNYNGEDTCYFFDDAATPAGSRILAPNPSPNYFYFEKVCLPAVTPHQACTYRSYAFERIRNYRMDQSVRRAVQSNSREECLASCLTEETFVCRSVNYNYNTHLCELNNEDRRSMPQRMRRATEDAVDYFDNNCLSRNNRCGKNGGNLVFVKTPAFEIHGQDHTVSMEVAEAHCLQKCLDSLNTFCRSVEYSESRTCVVSDEDTFSRADQQGRPRYGNRDYFEPVCVTTDITSSTCRQHAAFVRYIGVSLKAEPIASAQGVTTANCISMCFQNLRCRSINYVRTSMTCLVFAVNREKTLTENNPSTDYYEHSCVSEMGGTAICTPEGIRLNIVTRNPYTGAIYAAEHYDTCHKAVYRSDHMSLLLPIPTVSSNCGTVFKDGKVEAVVVVSLDGIVPHQVTTEWDRFYRVICDMSLGGVTEGTVLVTTMYDAGQVQAKFLPPATPPPISAELMILDIKGQQVTTACIGTDLILAVRSDQTGPEHMLLKECVATRVGGKGDSVPFKMIENGCPRYPAIVGPVVRDVAHKRLVTRIKAVRLDGSYDLQIDCIVQFCPGPYGCPPSQCLDGSTNQLFTSNSRRKKRGDLLQGDDDDVEAAASSITSQRNRTTVDRLASTTVETIQEQLSTVIRVLTEEESHDVAIQKLPFTFAKVEGTVFPEPDETTPSDMMCISEASFIATVVAASMLCLFFSGIIIAWAWRRWWGQQADEKGALSTTVAEDEQIAVDRLRRLNNDPLTATVMPVI